MDVEVGRSDDMRKSPACILLALATASSSTQEGGDGGGQAVIDAPEATELFSEVVTVPMSHASGHIALEAWVNGEGPFQFMLDTGAGGHGRIGGKLVEKLGLEKIDDVQFTDGSGNHVRQGSMVRVDSLLIGDVAFEGLKMLHADVPGMSGPGQGSTNIVGFPVFKDLLLTIDYPKSEIRMTRGELPKDRAGVIAYDSTRNIPVVEIAVGDRVLDARLDTGNGGDMLLSQSIAESLPVLGEPSLLGKSRSMAAEFEIWQIRLKDPFQFAGFTQEKPMARFASTFRGANIGRNQLKPYALTFDQKHDRLLVERPAD